MKIKSLSIGLLSFALAASLAACGNKNSADSASGSNPPATTPAQTADAQPKSDVTLTLWHWKAALDPGFKAAADEFKKKTGITVTTQAFTPDAAYNQKLTAADAANALPDIWMYWAGPAGGAFDGKAMEWQDELNNDQTWKNSFYPAALSGVTVAQVNVDAWNQDKSGATDWQKSLKPGVVTGVPIDVGAFYTIYGNAKLLQQAGLPTTPPASIEDWEDEMNTIKSKTGVPGLTFSLKSFPLYENWMANFVDYMQNGPDDFTKFMKRDETMSDPKHIGWVNFIDFLAKTKNLLPGADTLDIDQSDAAFAQGKTAFDLGGTFTYASLIAAGMNPDDIFSFRVPAFKNSKIADAKITPFPLIMANVNAKSPHQKEAVEFVKFLTSQEGMTLFANNGYDLPSIPLNGGLTPVLQKMQDSLSSESNWFSENQGIANLVWDPEFQQFNDNITKMLLGKMTADQVVKQFDKDQADLKAKDNKK